MAEPVDADADLRTQVAALVSAQQDRAPELVQRVRDATARLSVPDAGGCRARDALADVGYRARIDVDVPTASRHRREAWLKSAVKRLIRWYLAYLGDQVSVLGAAISRLGAALVERTEAIETSAGHLAERVDDLDARLRRLEGDGGR